MIILITGASLTGKTLLAQRMLEEYKMPYIKHRPSENGIDSLWYDRPYTRG